MIRVEINVVGVVGVEIDNPWVLDYGFGWRWRWRWLGLVGEGWVFLGFSGGGLYFCQVEIGSPPTPAYSAAESYHFHLN